MNKMYSLWAHIIEWLSTLFNLFMPWRSRVLVVKHTSRSILIKMSLLLILIIPLANCGGDVLDSRVTELYKQGNTLYEQGQYAEASRTYERIIDMGLFHGYVYYNLGNAYFKQDALGKAILAYERAQRLMPRDPDIRSNLEIVNLRIVDQLDVPDPWLGQTLIRSITINEITMVTSAIGLFLAICIIIFILVDRAHLRRLILRLGIVVLVLFLACGTILIYRVYDYNNVNAIIQASETEIRSGPDPTFDQLFTLHEGTKVSIVEERGRWMRILLPDGKTGWINQQVLEII